MLNKFQTPNARLPDGRYDIGAPTVEKLLGHQDGWHYVVMNTYSQEAALLEQRQDGFGALDDLAPMLGRARAIPVLMSTPAYREHAKGSESIGDWQDFTFRQSEGFLFYSNRLAGSCVAPARQPRVAEVNRAFELVHGEDPDLWRELFYKDNFHPSALGSFLEACVIYCAVFREAPVLTAGVLEDPASLWSRARRMLPNDEVWRPPTADELRYLRSVAVRSCFSAEASGFEPLE